MDLFGPHNDSQFPSWEEIRLLMEGKLGADEEALLLERIKNSETIDPAAQALKGLLERSNYDTLALKESNQRLRNKISKTYNSPARSLPLKKIAAIFIFVAGVTSVLYFMNRSSDFSDAYIHDPGFPVYMSGESRPYNWMEAYRAGNFEHALEKILKHPDFEINDTLKYYAAVIFYEQGNFRESVVCLKNFSDSTFLEKALLLKAFNQYQLNNIDEAYATLEELKRANGELSAYTDTLMEKYFSQYFSSK